LAEKWWNSSKGRRPRSQVAQKVILCAEFSKNTKFTDVQLVAGVKLA